MKTRTTSPFILIKLALVLICALFTTGLFAADKTADEKHLQGKKNFDAYCASCHLGAMPEAPLVSALKLYPPERIITSLESGVMSTQGIAFSKLEKHNLAYYLTGKIFTKVKTETHFSCKETNIPTPILSLPISWNGFGGNMSSTRFMQHENTFTKANINKLSLKWAFAFPETTRVRSQPIVTPQMTFIGSQEGIIYALDTETGCAHWQFEADAEVRGALFLLPTPNETSKTLFFGDFKANVYALDAQSGKLLWKSNISNHPLATITGSIIADQERVYIPLSSTEVIAAARPNYPCCTFRGTFVALNRKDGSMLWTTYTTEKPEYTHNSSVGTKQYGPSGAPIWSSPTLDKKRGLIYVTTGQNYSSPATTTSDAALALDVITGEIKWSTQVTKNDAWNGACISKRPNCPKEDGPDFDLGASPMLVTDKLGKDRVVIGQKSGMVYALDPDKGGKILWQTRLGSGGTMGGVHWGMSADQTQIYVGISDLPTNNPYSVGKAQPGVNALDIQTGKRNWHYTPPFVCPKNSKFRCFNGISAAVSSSPNLVYAGGLDGMLRVLASDSGKPLWEFDTTQAIKTNNGIKGFGGAIESDGPVIANGKLFITSGYDKWGETPGNLLLVFSLAP